MRQISQDCEIICYPFSERRQNPHGIPARKHKLNNDLFLILG
jgi:hypothetical protein